jgi:CRP/FNR family cyclic AMP-dependent transcriptional regulator
MPCDSGIARKSLEDPLSYLPCSKIVECSRGQVLYSPENPSANLYVIIAGMVAVQRIAADGRSVLVDIYKTDELFGESALIDMSDTHEQATALEDTKVMIWARRQIEELVVRQPRLGIALLQSLTQRSIELTHRIESFSAEQIDQRLARSLIHLSQRFGQTLEDGSIRMMPITHELLSRYVGTSRELVTQRMNEFRQLGYVRYSRKEIVLYPGALQKVFGIHVIGGKDL